jgi:hypothetical protein
MIRPRVRSAPFLLACVAVAPTAHAYEVRLTQQRAGESLDGTVRGDGRTWSFHVAERGGRRVEFRVGTRTVAALTADASGATADVRVGAVRWNTRDDAPPISARAATDVRTAIAIREAAIKLADIAPGPANRMMRLAVLELYSETARVMPESRVRGAAGRRLPMPRSEPARNEAVCETYTEDALFDCRDDEGNDVAVVPFIDDPLIDHDPNVTHRHHEPNECYGACGASCEGKCIEVPVACPAPDARPSDGALCYAPHPEDGKQYRPSDEFDTSNTLCPVGTTVGGMVTVCTSASCCFQHDECNRHDRQESLGAYLKCQMWGLRECGFSAVYGVPKTPWRLKWFRAAVEGSPIALVEGPDVAGICKSGDWTPPDVIPHDAEQATCPIHGVKHRAHTRSERDDDCTLCRWWRGLFGGGRDD